MISDEKTNEITVQKEGFSILGKSLEEGETSITSEVTIIQKKRQRRRLLNVVYDKKPLSDAYSPKNIMVKINRRLIKNIVKIINKSLKNKKKYLNKMIAMLGGYNSKAKDKEQVVKDLETKGTIIISPNSYSYSKLMNMTLYQILISFKITNQHKKFQRYYNEIMIKEIVKDKEEIITITLLNLKFYDILNLYRGTTEMNPYLNYINDIIKDYEFEYLEDTCDLLEIAYVKKYNIKQFKEDYIKKYINQVFNYENYFSKKDLTGLYFS